MYNNYKFQHLDYLILREWVRRGFEERNLQISPENLTAVHLLDIDRLDRYDMKMLCTNPNAEPSIRELVVTNPGRIEWALAFEYVDGIYDLAIPIIKTLKILHRYFKKEHGQSEFGVYALEDHHDHILKSVSKSEARLIIDNWAVVRQLTHANIFDECMVSTVVGALSSRPEAIEVIRTNLEYACWRGLSSNAADPDLLRANLDKLNWTIASANPAIVDVLTANLDKICKANLSTNFAAKELIDANPDMVDWSIVSSDENMIAILESNLDRVNWVELSSNPHPRAVRMLEMNPDKINHVELSWNHSAIDLIKQIGKYDVYNLSCNLGAMQILETVQDQLDWYELTSNPGIISYDYQRIKLEREDINKAIPAYVFHPSRIAKWMETTDDIADYMD